MKRIVFLGPTLPADCVPEHLPDCQVRPPVRQGDVLRAVKGGADRIGIIDGFFDQVPSVWHKEILYAMEQGVLVLGSASIGALRAAELHRFGMIGVGRVFELFRDGVLEDDDEVAVAHGAADSGYRPLSDAMVNIRDRTDAAVEQRVVPSTIGSSLLVLAKDLPYPERSFKRVIAGARQLGLPTDALDRYEAFVTASHSSLKERDAVAMLRRMASGEARVPEERARVERTVYLERLLLHVDREAGGAGNPSGSRPAAAAGEPLSTSQQALLGLLAEKVADLVSSPATDADLTAAAREFCASHGLRTPEAARQWLDRRGLTGERFGAGLRELAAIRKLEQLYAPEIDVRIRQQLTLAPRP